MLINDRARRTKRGPLRLDGNVRDRPFICKFESFSRRDDFLHGYMREGELKKNRKRKKKEKIELKKKATRPDCYHSDREREIPRSATPRSISYATYSRVRRSLFAGWRINQASDKQLADTRRTVQYKFMQPWSSKGGILVDGVLGHFHVSCTASFRLWEWKLRLTPRPSSFADPLRDHALPFLPLVFARQIRIAKQWNRGAMVVQCGIVPLLVAVEESWREVRNDDRF